MKIPAILGTLLVTLLLVLGACAKPAAFEVTSLVVTPPEVTAGGTVSVTAEVRNTGGSEGSYTATLTVDGATAQTKEVALAVGASKTVSFSLVKDRAGTYQIAVGGLASSLRVKEKFSALDQLRITYPELLQELLKLPDLKDIDDKDNEAIEDIAYLTLNPEYKAVFESMLGEGIKNKRQYCAPLEALLWIAYDREFDVDNPLRDYSLAKLIDDAWKNATISKNYSSERWLDFQGVVVRLNSPELTATYMQNNFKYSYTQGEAEGVKSAEQIFKDKKGACYDHALFAAYCLKKNGYDKAWGARVKFDRIVRGYFIGHIGCIYQDPKDSLYYCMDFGSKGYTVYGPFSSTDEAAKLNCKVGSGGEASLASYSLHDIDLETGKYKTTWTWW